MSTGTTIEYAGNYVYENGNLQFFNQPEGYVEPDGSGGYDYVYQYKDHLGNIRMSYKNTGSTSSPTLQIQEENNYYPFGLKHKGYNNGIITEHPYKYNGKELNQELGLDWYDYGARNYDAALGRWMNIDPLAEERNWLSPYNYVQNNPILRIDPNGMLDDDYFNENGEYLGSDEAETDNVQIITQKDWDENKIKDTNGNETISNEKGSELSSNITETQMSNDAVENVVEYYNNQLDAESKGENVTINAKPLKDEKGRPVKGVLMRSEIGGGEEILGIKFGEVRDINVNTTGGTVQPELNTARNITSTVVHEHHHQKVGRGTEGAAINAQKSHSSYNNTTPGFKKFVNRYGKTKN